MFSILSKIIRVVFIVISSINCDIVFYSTNRTKLLQQFNVKLKSLLTGALLGIAVCDLAEDDRLAPALRVHRVDRDVNTGLN